MVVVAVIALLVITVIVIALLVINVIVITIVKVVVIIAAEYKKKILIDLIHEQSKQTYKGPSTERPPRNSLIEMLSIEGVVRLAAAAEEAVAPVVSAVENQASMEYEKRVHDAQDTHRPVEIGENLHSVW